MVAAVAMLVAPRGSDPARPEASTCEVWRGGWQRCRSDIVKHLPFAFAFVGSALFALVACTPPEVEACEDFVSAAQSCAEMNADPLSELDKLCDGDVPGECKEYYQCAAKAECKESGGVYRLASMPCTMPENKTCVPAN